MPPSDTPSYLRPYQQALRDFGPSFEATLWQSREAQVLRFDVAADFLPFDESTVVLDVGCGQGDLVLRLVERSIPFRRYVGVDALPEMIESARKRAINHAEFHAVDVLAESDWLSAAEVDVAVFSGSLNTMEESTARDLLHRTFSACRVGIVFNFLSDRCHPKWAGQDLAPARRFNTVTMIEWAFSLTSRVLFRQDYLLGHDATIALLHEPAV